ncbi:HEPN domain-containing protein [Variovorax sp. J22R115]|uniref:HEPN domain-containing protein n=1 Tax=Variovorax sp. J22R115 TaxID=3053509 RepID=UPI0025783CE5|nr:HEPN domain-containing protein [Variovorax sp. J22R115]MDM0053923.1 HEPN domain-containing protein [Variovorax sp. J22R115]
MTSHPTMSRARATFDNAIEDAVSLLQQFDAVHKDQSKLGDVLKRASLVMALTAWETFVEDRIAEAMHARLKAVNGSPIGKFVSGKLQDELKRFHNPNSEKTRKLFLDYLEIDVVSGWKWQHFEPPVARKTLDELIAKRGDAVHRSKLVTGGPPAPSLIKRDDLEKAIRFLRGLVEATDRTLLDV